jgi:hypothetical protein
MSDTPLIAAVRLRRVADVAALLAIGVDVHEPMTDGSGRTALHLACEMGDAEIASKLLAAKANVDQADSDGNTPMLLACFHGDFRFVQLLSSYGASRNFPGVDAPYDTAEGIATEEGHHEVAAWLVTSRFWTPLHHLEVLTPERALALKEAGADIHADDEPMLAVMVDDLDADDAPEEISFSLEQVPDPVTAAAAVVNLEKPHLRTPTQLTVKHLKKYLLKKIKTEMSVEVDFLCRGTLLDDEHSLGVIWRALWRDQADDLVLEFRLLPLEGSFEAAAAAELTALERRGTPLGRAKFLCMTGRAAAGSAAHIVLEWGAPWSRQTHKFYPPKVRARVAELMRVAQSIKRDKAANEVDGVLVGYENPGSVSDVFEVCLVKYLVASAYWR